MGPAPAKLNITLHHQMAHHSPISSIASLPQFLHGSINDVGVTQGAGCSMATARMVFRPMVDQLRTAQRDIVPYTERAHRGPRAGARVPTDAPHEADVVSAHVEGAGAGAAPVGQPARERVEQREGDDVLGGEVVRLVRKFAEGGGAGSPLSVFDDQE